MLSIHEVDKQFRKLIKITNKRFSKWPKEGFTVKPIFIEEDIKTGEIKTHETIKHPL